MPNIPNRSSTSTDGAPPDDATGRETTPGDDPVLSAQGIEKTYRSSLPFVGRDVDVLDGADVTLYPGEVVGIVGENGSGKSTLMQILVGAMAPDSGSVETTTTVGWCPQDALLYDRLTVAETFELFGEAYGLDAEKVESRRDELADRLGFTEFLDYRVDHLSGGNRQKVNLAVALLHDPDVLLLDEPYTGFDWETYLAFWDMTETLRDQGTAVAIISHLISERERFDRILELREGTLHEQTDSPGETRADAGQPGPGSTAASPAASGSSQGED